MRTDHTKTGRIAVWNDTAGYGFVVADSGRERVFVHTSGFVVGEPRPLEGDSVTYVVGKGRDGRAAATSVRIVGRVEGASANAVRPDAADMPRHVGLRILTAVLMVLLLAGGFALGRISLLIVGAYALMGLITASTYWVDKSAARTGQWRVAERSLHLLDLCGGIIGGLAAQAFLRHKTSKDSFAAATALIGALHLGALIFLVVR